jgi:hypothetical protein
VRSDHERSVRLDYWDQRVPQKEFAVPARGAIYNSSEVKSSIALDRLQSSAYSDVAETFFAYSMWTGKHVEWQGLRGYLSMSAFCIYAARDRAVSLAFDRAKMHK